MKKKKIVRQIKKEKRQGKQECENDRIIKRK